MDTARAVSLLDEAADDGSHTLVVEVEPGKATRVKVPLALTTELVSRFQQAAIDRAQKQAQNALLVTVTAYGIGVAHSRQACELMVSTEELGAVVVVASDELLRCMKVEIDKALAYRTGCRRRHVVLPRRHCTGGL